MARPSTRARCSSAQNRVMGRNSTKPRISFARYFRNRRVSRDAEAHRHAHPGDNQCIAGESALWPLRACFYASARVLLLEIALRCTQLPRRGAGPREEPVDGGGRLNEADRRLLREDVEPVDARRHAF